MTIKQLPESERPYEKLQIYGANKLSNAELLSIIIKNGTKEHTSIDLANKILKLKKQSCENSLRFMQDISVEEYMSIKGIGRVKAIGLKAVCELAKRMSKPVDITNMKVNCSQDIANMLMEELRYERREMVKIVILNVKNNVLKIEDIAIGGTDFVNISPKDVLTEVVKMNAPKMIMVHNHPSGDPSPSKADIEITNRIYECSNIMQIKFLDHIIIGDGKYESVFSKKGSWN
ncbi:MAG: DNA repair protein RadC [Clostridia bacterium]|nr:DNA repair protein RadC [Clostridia bacterium]